MNPFSRTRNTPSKLKQSILIVLTGIAFASPLKIQATELYDRAASQALLEASVLNETGDAQALLEAGLADPNAETAGRVQSEILSAYPDIPTSLKNLLASDVAITPLMAAAANGNYPLCKDLLLHGAKRWNKTKRWKTNAIWLACQNEHVEVIRLLLQVPDDSPARQTHLVIDRKTQTGYLKKGQSLFEFKVSTGKKSTPTRPGNYVITDKNKDHISTIYKVKMPYFLRLSSRDFGLHQGVLPGYPASHGCIRVSQATAKKLFEETEVGSTVTIN